MEWNEQIEWKNFPKKTGPSAAAVEGPVELYDGCSGCDPDLISFQMLNIMIF